MKRSTTWLCSAMLGLLLAGVAFSALRYRNAQDQAIRAEQQFHEVEGLAQQVQSQSQQVSVAVTHTGETQSLSGLVEAAASECGITAEQIISINAQDARRVGQTPYYRLPTRITLSDVTLPDLTRLLSKLSETQLLNIEDCRLFAPHDEIVGQRWNAEFTIAYLIYEPTQDPGNR